MTQPTLDDYRAIAPAGTVDFLRRLSERVRNRRLLNVSASREVGGVAEILRGLVPLVEARPRGGAWAWRCHLDVSRPQRRAWTFLRQYVVKYDAAVFSLPAFAQRLPIPQFMIYPAIDPLSDKNRELAPAEVAAICDRLSMPRDKPILLQVGRFDRFKDPLGVIEAYRLVKRQHDCRLVLVGGGCAGGIPAQVGYGVTGYTVNSVEGAAFRARQLLADPELRARLGAAARGHVRQHFLLTRHLGDMLALMATLGR